MSLAWPGLSHDLLEFLPFLDKAKLTEAFNLAQESKRKVSQFYMMNSRFPASEYEAEPMKTDTVTKPEYVEDMSVLPTGTDEIAIRVMLKPDAIENTGSGRQFVFFEARRVPGSSTQIEWSCGANGISSDILPDNCKG